MHCRIATLAAFLFIATTLVAQTAQAQETIHLSLRVNGAQVKGDSTQKGSEGGIECSAFEQSVAMQNPGSGMATNRAQYQPLRILKRVDKTSPLIGEALRRQAPIEAIFRFYKPSATGVATNYYTVTLQGARVASIKLSAPNKLMSENRRVPTTEEITFVWKSINYTFVDGGVTHDDTWTTGR